MGLWVIREKMLTFLSKLKDYIFLQSNLVGYIDALLLWAIFSKDGFNLL